MRKDKAIECLEDFIERDRVLRDGKAESDYEKFCEERCVAIETIIDSERKRFVELHKSKEEAQKYFKKSIEQARLINALASWIAHQDIDEIICKEKHSNYCKDNFVNDNCVKCVIDYFKDKLENDEK